MIKIDKFIPGGQAIATLPSGKKAFFWNALPGEEVVEYEIRKEKASYLEAVATKIEKPSEFRVEPLDAHFLSTSPFQILDYSYELKVKQELVKEQYREQDIDVPLPEIVTDGKDYFYRNKAEYSLYWDKATEKILPAVHRRGTHQKAPISSSALDRPEIWQRAQEIINELNNRGEPAYKYQSLLLRCDQKGNVSGGLFENRKPHPVFDTLKDDILGHTYSYSPNGFFQINLPVYELALMEIRKHVETPRVLDLYSGVGTIGLSLEAPESVTLVESNPSAFEELKKNCENRKNARPLFKKSEEALDEIEKDQTVILDPPRAGCDGKLLSRLLEVTPEKIIYLSCNPATQARDAKILSEKYRIKEIKLFNFFPRTPHIESLIIFVLK